IAGSGTDIRVDRHLPSPCVSATVARRRDVQRLARVAGIARADLDRGEAGRGTSFVIPHAEHLGYAASLERPPDLRRPGNALEQAGFVDWLVLRRAGEDRIVPVKGRLHVDAGPLRA